MKNLLIVILLAFTFSLSGQSNNFEGKITYSIKYLDSLGNELNADSLKMDKKMYYFISNGNYKSLNEKGEITQLYNYMTNKYYFNYQDQIQVMDASFKFPKSGMVKKLDGEQTILNRKCKKLNITSELESTIYFYAEDVKVDYEKFTNHNFGNWNLFLNATLGALSIKYETIDTTTGITTIMEAIEIKQIELTEKDFDINAYIKK